WDLVPAAGAPDVVAGHGDPSMNFTSSERRTISEPIWMIFLLSLKKISTPILSPLGSVKIASAPNNSSSCQVSSALARPTRPHL
ncbi:MAG: hypothetical protein JRN15_09910, partial [Nitrososphaerota archaeon]|nr:hypothetical protein [Nitrososphaerota archaeon]